MNRYHAMPLLLEHTDFIRGTTYEESLILGGVGGILNEMELNESTSALGGKLLKFRGKLQEAETINKNKRSYPKGVLEENVKRLLETIELGGLIGELDHPSDSIVHFEKTSHKITKLWWEGNCLMGEGFILDTPAGRILRGLINGGVRIGMSSRGVGNGKVNEDGILVIGEGYRLVTFDAVADPSTHEAYQKKVVGATKEENTIVVPNYSANSSNSFVKNEASSIDTVNCDAVLACLSGMFKTTTNQVKARLR